MKRTTVDYRGIRYEVIPEGKSGRNVEKEIYKEQGIDMRKLFVRFVRLIRIPILAVLFGALVGAGIYEITYLCNNGLLYQGQSKIYLDFSPNAGEDTYHQYYNGYTWNDLITTDPILDKTMTNLEEAGVDVAREEVAASTEAKILSDVRLLTIYITNRDATLCEQIQKATEQALETYGAERDVFTSIYAIKSEQPIRLMADYRIKQAILLGAVLVGLTAVFGLLGYLILDDRLFVPSDLLGNMEAPFLGLEIVGESVPGSFTRDLQANLEYFCGDGYAVISVEDMMCEKTSPVDYGKLRDASCVLVRAGFGKTSLRSLQYALQQLSLQGCHKIGVVLADADEKWLRQYYRWRLIK